MLRALYKAFRPNVDSSTGEHSMSAVGTVEDRAWGCVLGAFAGDAAGVFLEFRRGNFTDDVVQHALTMPGGGVFEVGPGQITDDSELAMCLAQGLAGHDPAAGLPVNDIAQWYTRWLRSSPFDVGGTCRAALSVPQKPSETVGERVLHSAATNCTKSAANGALMRVTPLAVWAAAQPPQVVAEYAMQEAALTHPNLVCQEANALYCLAIQHLLLHAGDHAGAVQAAESWAVQHCRTEVKTWLLTDSQDIGTVAAHTNIGWVRWAFVLAFYFLRAAAPYEEAIRQTLQLRGDTDTNAAIVGGLLGALHGRSALPDYMTGPVLAFDACAAGSRGRPGHQRPEFLCPHHSLPGLMQQLIPKQRQA